MCIGDELVGIFRGQTGGEGGGSVLSCDLTRKSWL